MTMNLIRTRLLFLSLLGAMGCDPPEEGTINGDDLDIVRFEDVDLDNIVDEEPELSELPESLDPDVDELSSEVPGPEAAYSHCCFTCSELNGSHYLPRK